MDVNMWNFRMFVQIGYVFIQGDIIFYLEFTIQV